MMIMMHAHKRTPAHPQEDTAKERGAEDGAHAEDIPGSPAYRIKKLKGHTKLTGALAGVANRARLAREKRAAKLEVQAAVNYIIFLALFTFSVLSSDDAADKFTLSSKITGLLQKDVIDELSNPDLVYDYLENFIPTVLYTNTFDGDSSFTHDPTRGDLLGTCKVIGGIRLGQLRTDSVPCDLPDMLRVAHAESPNQLRSPVGRLGRVEGGVWLRRNEVPLHAHRRGGRMA